MRVGICRFDSLGFRLTWGVQTSAMVINQSKQLVAVHLDQAALPSR